MNPITHLLLSWGVANSVPGGRRERAAVTLAGLVPDLDGLGAVAELATRGSARPLAWYSEYHRVLPHNVLGAVAVAAACAAVARRRLAAALGGLAAFHLHLLGDLLGSQGPDGSQWEIYYLWPFTRAWPWSSALQWRLDAWPNVLITTLALALAFYLAWRRGFSPLELLSRRADAALVATLRRRFPRGAAPARPG